MFLLRRVVYALVIVFMGETMLFPVLIVMLCCLVMLAYALLEMQWEDRIINYQHICDEITIYLTCVLLLLFSNVVDARDRVLLGYILIGVCFAYVAFNTIVIMIYSLQKLYLYLKRIIVQCRRRNIRNQGLTAV